MAEARRRRTEAIAALDEIADTCSRILESFRLDIPDRTDIVWIARDDNRGSVHLRVAPLSVAGLLRGGLFNRATAVLTSATLTPGRFVRRDRVGIGVSPDRMQTAPVARHRRGIAFPHAKSGILYVARHLPPPGRDGTGSAEQLAEIAALISAARGRTLGLFSSMRAATAAAERDARTAQHAGAVPG